MIRDREHLGNNVYAEMDWNRKEVRLITKRSPTTTYSNIVRMSDEVILNLMRYLERKGFAIVYSGDNNDQK